MLSDHRKEDLPMNERILIVDDETTAGEIAMSEDVLHYLYPEAAVDDTVRPDLRV